jgi:hypothetical protein
MKDNAETMKSILEDADTEIQEIESKNQKSLA